MRRCLWLLALVVLNGCGGSGQKALTGSLSVIVNFPSKRVIPPETQRVRVQVSGQGLTQPLEQVAERPSTEGGEIRLTFTDVPIGFKTVSATAEDRYGTHRATGSAETSVVANQTTRVIIELGLTRLASVIGRVTNIRTGQPATGVTIQIHDRQGTSGNDGTFAVTNVPEGGQTLTVSSPEYRGYNRNISVSVPLTDLGELFVLPQQLMTPPDSPPNF
ncbi:MAG: carboxypeptidase-like regulatory domain-containing protein [Armatimonadetes bacterium]|nr:carboxypeptidase-like regulatory domain-containing protein [Armatimonadota bacterium]